MGFIPSKNSNLVIGRKPVLEALEQGKEFEKVLLQNNANGELIGDIIRACKVANVPLQRVPVQKLHSLTKSNHQGIVAFGALVKYYSLQDVIDNIVSQGRSPKILWLDGITDVRNVGAIARTAICFDIDAVVYSEKNSALLNEEAVKASAGALMNMTFCREKNSELIGKTLLENGLCIYSSSLDAEKTMNEIDFTLPFAVVMGAEEIGISNYVKKISTETFIIPMSPKFDSLNVSVATGIICQEIFKQNN